MNISCAGISHQTAPAGVRAAARITAETMLALLPRIRALGFPECAAISTEERTEFYAAGPDPSLDADALVQFLLSGPDAQIPVQPAHCFSLNGPAATAHLFSVVSGLDSMIVGDTTLLPAVQEGFARARQSAHAGPILQRLLSAAERTHARVTTETSISEGAVSVGHAAVELAQRIFDDLRQRDALILGTGETAHMTARLLHQEGIRSLTIANRNRERAEQLARSVDGTTIALEDLQAHLAATDIIIASLQSELHIVTSKLLRESQKHRHGDTLFLVDCGVPKNIDPFAGELENVFLYDLDTLNLMVSDNIAKRRTQVARAQAIVAEEARRLSEWLESTGPAPSFERLSRVIERIREEEVSKEIGHFSSSDLSMVEELTRRITDRITQLPAEHLTSGPEGHVPDRTTISNLVRKVLGLNTGKRE